jgi:hypothetical protein
LQSNNNPHFSDFSFYPDRFTQPESGSRPVLKSATSSEIAACATTSATPFGTPSPALVPFNSAPITKYNFRIRYPLVRMAALTKLHYFESETPSCSPIYEKNNHYIGPRSHSYDFLIYNYNASIVV